MRTPLSTLLSEDDLELIRLMVEFGSVRLHPTPITLASGRTSSTYLHFRAEMTNRPGYWARVGEHLKSAIHALHPRDQVCILPVPSATQVLADAASLASVYLRRKDASASSAPFIAVRQTYKEKKEHGADRGRIAGTPESTERYVVLEAVSTSGQSTVNFINDARDEGYLDAYVPHCILLVARSAEVERSIGAALPGATVRALFKLPDLLYVIREMKLWHDREQTATAYEAALHEWYGC